MRHAARLAGLTAAIALAAGCTGQRRAAFFDAYDKIIVGVTPRSAVDGLLEQEPVRPGKEEVFVSPEGDPYIRLEYTHDAPQGLVIAKHLLSYTDRVGLDTRTLKLRRVGVIRPDKPARYRLAIRARQIDPLIDLLAPGAGTLSSVLNETPLVHPKFTKVVSIRDEFRPEVPPPPEDQRHLPEVYLYTRRGRIPDFHESHRGFGRWTLLTRTGELHSAFFVPGRIYPGSRSYRRVYADADGYLTFEYHFKNYGETVDTTVAVKEQPRGTFHVRYETTADFVRRP